MTWNEMKGMTRNERISFAAGSTLDLWASSIPGPLPPDSVVSPGPSKVESSMLADKLEAPWSVVHPGKQKLAIVVLPGPVRNQLDHLGGVADDFIRPHILGMMDDHQAQNGQEDAEEGKGCPDGRPLEEVFEVLHLQIFFQEQARTRLLSLRLWSVIALSRTGCWLGGN